MKTLDNMINPILNYFFKVLQPFGTSVLQILSLQISGKASFLYLRFNIIKRIGWIKRCVMTSLRVRPIPTPRKPHFIRIQVIFFWNFVYSGLSLGATFTLLIVLILNTISIALIRRFGRPFEYIMRLFNNFWALKTLPLNSVLSIRDHSLLYNVGTLFFNSRLVVRYIFLRLFLVTVNLLIIFIKLLKISLSLCKDSFFIVVYIKNLFLKIFYVEFFKVMRSLLFFIPC